MNVLFHTTTAIGVAVLLTDTNRLQTAPAKKILATGVFAFLLGILAHGALDYVPHCYPLPSKVDAVLGLAMILGLLWRTNPPYRLVMGLACLGCVFPDVIDLSPAILNKYAGFSLPVYGNLFPWHWKAYSGSLYTADCSVSTANHVCVVFMVATVCWFRRSDMLTVFNMKKQQNNRA